jgi:pantothenate kinase
VVGFLSLLKLVKEGNVPVHAPSFDHDIGDPIERDIAIPQS